MPKICLYLQLHQPYRLKDWSLFDVGNNTNYWGEQNQEIFHKVAAKSYLPMLSLLQELIDSQPEFSFALSVSGVFLEQAETYEPKVIDLLKNLAKSDRVEFLSETYYHSLASLYSRDEFVRQVKMHQEKLYTTLGAKSRVFRNTELVYSNHVAKLLENHNFAGILTEGVDRYLKGRPRTQIYLSKSQRPMPVLLKHAQLSDDIAFRFSDRNWDWYPLGMERYMEWIDQYREDEIINLFMDFETFGEHQWEDTGIFEFFKAFVNEFVSRTENKFMLPTDLFYEFATLHYDQELSGRIYDVPEPISWADIDRDLTAWIGNELQKDTIGKIYELEEKVLATRDQSIINDWRLLQTSDHFYYMCVKWSQDGDVHAYFSPYEDPFEAYRIYSLALADLEGRLLSWQEH